jgi:uncharacterized C2H2 Zn-finger protein
MSKGAEPAASCWQIDRQTCGQVLRPYCVVILRNKKKVGRSVVKASSTDFESMHRYAEQLKKDLEALTNAEFVRKYQLGSM